MKYSKPRLLKIDMIDEQYCSVGSLASSSSGTMCATGNGASNLNSYCVSTGNGASSSTCVSGSIPGNGYCSTGQAASGWGSCSTGSLLGLTCNSGNSA